MSVAITSTSPPGSLANHVCLIDLNVLSTAGLDHNKAMDDFFGFLNDAGRKFYALNTYFFLVNPTCGYITQWFKRYHVRKLKKKSIKLIMISFSLQRMFCYFAKFPRYKLNRNDFSRKGVRGSALSIGLIMLSNTGSTTALERSAASPMMS